MGRLNPIASGVIIVLVIAVIEFVGQKADNIFARSTPEATIIVTLLSIFIISIWAKANTTTILTVALGSIAYGVIAYTLHLEFYYHDYPELFSGFIIILLIRTLLYIIPVIAGYYTVAFINKKQVNNNGSN
ncbi:hypothetical protein KI811_08260 [Geobacter hydrogenophilus]|uniref:Uncharacterized protein n=1 Tax=Geobacter hydrogenophilus TaxID=40983 RepID=A0A9W6LAT9_9BACT|nr:hypothetical protein [Geobacter hydrogenophilus]MBT0893804.1 hypothetical protein [Geobacter hydrogenophilus]GLI37498.1 hypothetical protein GHYDROH2_09990 [Geobacter hydrogenophilus]